MENFKFPLDLDLQFFAMDEKLIKSLEEIDKKADEVIAKSAAAKDEDKDSEKGSENLKADDVSDDKADSGESEEKKEASKEDAGDDKADDKEVQKSLADLVDEDEEMKKSLEVSEFLKSFTELNSGVLEGLRGDINKSLETSTHTATILAKSFGAIMKSQEGLMDLVKSQDVKLQEANELIKSLEARLEDVEKQPVVRKSVINTVEKSFNHSAGLENAGEAKELSKSEKVEKLTALALDANNSSVTVQDVLLFESTGEIRPEIEQFLK